MPLAFPDEWLWNSKYQGNNTYEVIGDLVMDPDAPDYVTTNWDTFTKRQQKQLLKFALTLIHLGQSAQLTAKSLDYPDEPGWWRPNARKTLLRIEKVATDPDVCIYVRAHWDDFPKQARQCLLYFAQPVTDLGLNQMIAPERGKDQDSAEEAVVQDGMGHINAMHPDAYEHVLLQWSKFPKEARQRLVSFAMKVTRLSVRQSLSLETDEQSAANETVVGAGSKPSFSDSDSLDCYADYSDHEDAKLGPTTTSVADAGHIPDAYLLEFADEIDGEAVSPKTVMAGDLTGFKRLSIIQTDHGSGQKRPHGHDSTERTESVKRPKANNDPRLKRISEE